MLVRAIQIRLEKGELVEARREERRGSISGVGRGGERVNVAVVDAQGDDGPRRSSVGSEVNAEGHAERPRLQSHASRGDGDVDE